MKNPFTRLSSSLMDKLMSRKRPASINFSQIPIPYIERGRLQSGVRRFGGPSAEYTLWRPNMCSICCVKAVGDATNMTRQLSLFDLIKLSLDEGVFQVRKDGSINGAFHYPLKNLLHKLGIPARVESSLTTQKIKNNLQAGKVIFLSVNLAKSRHITSEESHMVTVYRYNAEYDNYSVHDSSSVISENGNATRIHSSYLDELSNSRGLVIG